MDIIDIFKDLIATESELIEEWKMVAKELAEEKRREGGGTFKAPAGIPPKPPTKPVPVGSATQTTKKRGKRPIKTTAEEYLKRNLDDAATFSGKSKKSKLDVVVEYRVIYILFECLRCSVMLCQCVLFIFSIHNYFTFQKSRSYQSHHDTEGDSADDG